MEAEMKLKLNLSKKQKVAVIAILLMAILAIAGILTFKKSEVNMSVGNSELARAMTYAEVEKGEEAVEGTDNVKFDAFFLRDLDGDGYAESIRGTCKEIGTEDTLYMELNVQTAGYLKDAKIAVNSDNFYLQTSLPKDQELKDNYIGNNIKEIEHKN